MHGIPKPNWGKDTERDFEHNRSNIIARLSSRCLFDFKFFCEHILGIKNLSPFHMKPTIYVFKDRYVLIVWARGHLKTTIWTENYAIWKLWREHDIEIAIVSSTLEQSQRSIENIQTKIEENEFLRQLIPKDKTTTWNKTQINTENGNKCYQKPFNSTSRGTHVDYLIMDDILREENLSQEQIKEFFWGIFYPMVQTRKGQLLMIGTPQTTKDLFADLEKNDDWKKIKQPCVEVDAQGVWVKPVWDKQFTLDELKSIKNNQGPLVFEREYMCNPMGGGANVFGNITIGKQSELHKPLPNEEYYMGCDIAMTAGAKRDFTAFSILGKNKETGKILQRKLERYKGYGEKEIIERIQQLSDAFAMRKIFVENVGLTVGLVQQLENTPGLPVEGFLTNKPGKEEIISSIAVGFETGALEILDNTIQYNELIGFKAKEDARTGKMTYEGVGEHDDTVIALGLAMLAVNSETTGAASVSFVTDEGLAEEDYEFEEVPEDGDLDENGDPVNLA